MPVPTGFGELLRRHRLQLDLTQEALAERAGLALRSVQALERGETRPRRDTAERLARALALDGRRRVELESLAQPAPRRRQTGAYAVSSGPAELQPPNGPTSPDGHRNNLPLELTSFIGREREVEEVRRLLSAHRLVTLTGTGGCGKTRLAYQTAAEVLGEYPDGVWMVELASLSDPALVVQTTAKALGLQEQGTQPILTVLVGYLKPRHLLLILDNCEHLVEACAGLTDLLLHSAPGLRILATSRELLGVAGESAYRVPSLATPKAGEVPALERLSQYESVRLLVDRALLVSPEFALTERNAPAVAQVCQRLDGIPLAIELAAARLAALSVEQVAARLTDRFRLLTGGSRTALRRQQTLRATIDWSHDLLSIQERAAFRRLAVFAGGWTLGAAEAVCAGSAVEPGDVLDLLSALVQKSLVVADVEAGEARYRLPETIRQYAQEKLWDSGETAATRERHRDWFARLVASFEDVPYSDAGAVAWIDRMQAEHDNLRAALQWCLETNPDEGLRMAVGEHGGLFGGVDALWFRRGYQTEGRRWVADLLAKAPESSPYRAPALCDASAVAWAQGDLADAVVLAEGGVLAEREHESVCARTMALTMLGTVAGERGDYVRAEELLMEAYRQAGSAEPALGSLALQQLGDAIARSGDMPRARRLFDQALALARQAGNGFCVAGTLTHLGRLTCSEGSYDRAQELLEEGLAIYRRLRSDNHVPWLLGLLGYTLTCAGDHRRGLSLLREGLAGLRSIGALPRIARLVYWIGVASQRQGASARAARLIATATAIHTPSEARMDSVQQAVCASAQADARAALGEEAFARAWAEGQAMTLEQAVWYALDEDDNGIEAAVSVGAS